MLRVQPLGSSLDSGHLWNQNQRALRSKTAFQEALLAETQEDADGAAVTALVPVAAAPVALAPRGGTAPTMDRSRRLDSQHYRARHSAISPIFLDIVV
jgi:hypothetical protein